MEPETPQPDDDGAEKPPPIERLAKHGNTILIWVATGFVIAAVFLVISLYRKFNHIGAT